MEEEYFQEKKFYKQKNFWLGAGAALVLFLIFSLGARALDDNRNFVNFSDAYTKTLSDVFGMRREKPIYEIDLGREKAESFKKISDLEFLDDKKDVGSRGSGVASVKSLVLPSVQTKTDVPVAVSENKKAVLPPKILINEVMAGSSASADDEFIEIYNYGVEAMDLTGWSIKKKSASGSEQTLVSAERLKGKIILPGKYFLMASEKYQGKVLPEVTWAKSYALAYENNSLEVLNPKGEVIDKVQWIKIPKDKSYARVSLDIAAGFEVVDNPSPTNSE